MEIMRLCRARRGTGHCGVELLAIKHMEEGYDLCTIYAFCEQECRLLYIPRCILWKLNDQMLSRNAPLRGRGSRHQRGRILEETVEVPTRGPSLSQNYTYSTKCTSFNLGSYILCRWVRHQYQLYLSKILKSFEKSKGRACWINSLISTTQSGLTSLKNIFSHIRR